MTDHGRRRPKIIYKGRNGFTEPSVPLTDPGKKLFGATNLRLTQHVLSHQGSYFPSCVSTQPSPRPLHSEAERSFFTQPHSASHAAQDDDDVRARLKDAQREHVRDLQGLYALHAEEYHREAMDRYLSRDDETAYWAQCEEDAPDWAQLQVRLLKIKNHGFRANCWRAAAQKLYEDTRRTHPLLQEWSNAVSHARYAHLRTAVPLLAHRAALGEREDAERKRRDAQFPATKEEWRACARREAQLRVARFLMLGHGELERAERERLMAAFGWAWRQVKPLCDVYENDVSGGRSALGCCWFLNFFFFGHADRV
jgi:hypothetical protein